nr:hypothetical protein [Vibrio cholerae]
MQHYQIDEITLNAMIRLCSLTLTAEQRLELIKAHLLNIQTPTTDEWDEF